jgi:hypothetical protein
MANAITTISPLFSTPYLTIAEFKQAPTAVDVDDLVGGGTSAINDQELTNVIARASSWVDAHCGQVLASTTDTEALRARFDRMGFLKIHPRFSPITELVSLSYGPLPTLLASVDISTVWIEPETIIFPVQAFSAAFSGPIQFSGNYSSTQEQFVSVTYVNGYANTVLTASVSASATSLPVSDLAGFTPLHQFMAYDGSSTELLTVSSSFVATSGAGNLPLANATRYAHASGISVSGLPPAVKQAAIYVTSAILKARGNASLVMQRLTPATIQSANPSAAGDLMSAWDLLKPYRRIR